MRRRRRRPNQRAARYAVPSALIDQRPRVVEARVRGGDWEGDLITARESRSAIGTLLERQSRYVKLVQLPDGHNSKKMRDALIETLRTIPLAPIDWTR